MLEVNSEQYDLNSLDDLMYTRINFGFVLPKNFEKKEEFINNFKSLDAMIT